MNKEEDDERRRGNNQWPHPSRGYPEKENDMRLWGILIFGLIGATVTTFAVTQLRSTVDWISSQLSRSQSSWKSKSSFARIFKRKQGKDIIVVCKKNTKQRWREWSEFGRMQSVFNRERNKYKRQYDHWQQHDPGAYHQHSQRNDWYWKEDASFRDHASKFRESSWSSTTSSLSHHYTVLGLDRRRTKPYTDGEIKSAFRTKAKEFHPDQNQNNKEIAEAKFKEVMVSYEAIKSERKTMGINKEQSGVGVVFGWPQLPKK